MARIRTTKYETLPASQPRNCAYASERSAETRVAEFSESPGTLERIRPDAERIMNRGWEKIREIRARAVMRFIMSGVLRFRRFRRLLRDAGTQLCDGAAVQGRVHQRERRQGGLHRARESAADCRLAGGGRGQYNQHTRHQACPWQRDDSLSQFRGRGLPAGCPLGHL